MGRRKKKKNPHQDWARWAAENGYLKTVGQNDDLPFAGSKIPIGWQGLDLQPSTNKPPVKPDIKHLLNDPEILKNFVGISLGVPPEGEVLKATHLAVFADGIYRASNTPVGRTVLRVAEFKDPGFPPRPESWNQGFHFKFPRIPAELLFQVMAFFKEVNKRHKAEAFVSIWWDSETETYRVEVPPQKVAGARVEHDQDGMNLQGQQIMQIHSHVEMSAFWSSVDDADERQQGNLIYGVIGKIQWEIPESKWRTRAGKQFVDLHMGALFEFQDYTITHRLNGQSMITGVGSETGVSSQLVKFLPTEGVEFPPEWMDQVSVASVVVGNSRDLMRGPNGQFVKVNGVNVETNPKPSPGAYQPSWWAEEARAHLKDDGADIRHRFYGGGD